jgi:hypothetical protein
MAQKPKQPPKAAMPSAAPVVATQARAESVEDIGAHWIIVAVRPNGRGEWEPTMPYDQYRVFREMKADGAYATTQRRDPAGTVLLAKLKVD